MYGSQIPVEFTYSFPLFFKEIWTIKDSVGSLQLKNLIYYIYLEEVSASNRRVKFLKYSSSSKKKEKLT